MGMGLALALSASPAVAVAADRAAEGRITELKAFLAKKERDLAGLSSERMRQLQGMEKLAKEVERQKADQNPGWLERRSLERNMARLRDQAEDVKKLSDREGRVRDEALAGATAIVAELEVQLENVLLELRDAGEGGSVRRALAERVLDLERERRFYQGKANGLMPELRLPADLPRGVKWTPEMVEDQRRSIEAAAARMEAELSLLLQERRLSRLMVEVLPEAAGGQNPVGVDARIKFLERGVGKCRKKLAGLPVPAGAGDAGGR